MTTMTVSVTNLPAIQTAITFVIDLIDDYAWHKPDCVIFIDNKTMSMNRDCDCGYDEALATLNTLRIRHIQA